jgi:hypothetical protein
VRFGQPSDEFPVSAVCPIAQIVHRPSFERGYESFWEEVSLGIEPSNSVQAIVLAAMFSGVSMDESVIVQDFGVAKASLIDNFKLGTETALGRANFLRTTKVEMLQAFILYLVSIPVAYLAKAKTRPSGSMLTLARSHFVAMRYHEHIQSWSRCHTDGRMHGSASGWGVIRSKPSGDPCSSPYLASNLFLRYSNV